MKKKNLFVPVKRKIFWWMTCNFVSNFALFYCCKFCVLFLFGFCFVKNYGMAHKRISQFLFNFVFLQAVFFTDGSL